MITRLLPACLAALLAGTAPTAADPWPRARGDVFLSFSLETTVDLTDPFLRTASETTLYGEIGLGGGRTLGTDLFRSETDHAYFFYLQQTLTPPDARHQLAFRAGFGNGANPAETFSLLLAGASWGTGFDTRWGSGWAVLDGQIRQRSTGGEERKLDLTLGLAPDENWLGYVQVQGSDYPRADTSLRLQASVARRISRTFTLETGVIYGLHNDTRAGLKLGLWSEF